jgi:radical SAM protein with 4Fe4S-binding SPASM domain
MDKKKLLEESKVFCMFPWVHLNVTPYGSVYPCCSSAYTDPYGNTKDNSLEEIFNNDRMKQLRLNMLEGKETSICTYCYKHEQSSPFSFRKYSIEHFSTSFDDIVTTTQDDGTVPDFKMKYFDVRFSNICNFKCRTCGKQFSSTWAQEDFELYPEMGAKWDYKIVRHADDTGRLLEDIKSQICHIDFAYFAGGEPLITEEHYIILEEMIKSGRAKEIVLRYNTNASNFKYKKYDIFDLWKHFKKIELSASLDHYGEKAEYIRHGTDWGVVENNLLKIRTMPNIEFQFNTVLSIFNYVTLKDFFEYMISKELLQQTDMISIYRALTPSYFCSQSLPASIKEVGNYKNKEILSWLVDNKYYQHDHIRDAIEFTNEKESWQENTEEFNNNIKTRDKLRNENFVEIFPELKEMYE